MIEIPKKPVIVTREFDDINELSIQFALNTMPDWVILAVKTPSDYSDMRFVSYISKKYKNVRFCGGKFIRLQGCNVGCICRENIPDKIPESDINYYTDGCSCILVSMHIEDVEGLEYIYDDVPKMEKKKKVVNNLDDLMDV